MIKVYCPRCKRLIALIATMYKSRIREYCENCDIEVTELNARLEVL
jgi:predicted transcriptional regulator